jgi:hypothetical protein
VVRLAVLADAAIGGAEQELMLLPSQRPASPEMYESPMVTTAVLADRGPAYAADATPALNRTAAVKAASRTVGRNDGREEVGIV